MAESNQTMPSGSDDDGWMEVPSHEQETAPSPRSEQDWEEPQKLQRPEPQAEPTILAGQEPVPDDEAVPDDEEAIELPVSPKALAIGCGALAVIGVVALLIVVLFVPPFNLASEFGGVGGSCKRLNANTPSIRHDDGIAVSIAGESGPCVGLGSIPRATFLEGGAKKPYKGAQEALPAFLDMKSPLYTLKWRGDEAAAVEIDIPNEAEPFNTLDLYTWDKEQEEWVFVPSQIDVGAQVIRTDEHPTNVAVFQTRATTPLISTFIEANQPIDGMVISSLNLALPTGLNAQDDGSVQGTLVGGWQLGAGYAVIPVVRAAGNGSLTGLLNNDSVLSIHISDLVNYVSTEGYNGIAIDYAAISPADREAFASFITELGAELAGNDKLLVVVLPQPAGTAGIYETGGYDWRAIGKAADIVILNMSRNPADYAPNGPALMMLDWAVGEISRFKLHPSFSSLSAADENGITLISYDDAVAPLGSVTLDTSLPEGAENFEEGASLTFDLNGDITDLLPDQSTGAYTYISGERHVWIVTASAVRARLDRTSAYNVGGISITDLLSEGNDSGLPTVINEFKARSVSSVPSQIVLKWTVTGASGAVLDESTGLGTPFVWQAGGAGDYTVKAELVGGRVSDRGSVGVQVGAAATEETPTPTVPAVINTGDSTPAATQASTPPPSVGGGGDGGGFALGGQVPNSIGHAAQMQQAGMTWVKFQAKYPYVDAGTAGGFVSAGHAAGFKVLLSIPGPPYPSSIDFGGYIEHLKGVAASQPDAIEVWNEMNIDAEWPPGQIDPTSYVNNMLAPAYNAIKGVSPNTMVIIGALAPTGFFGGGCSANGCDDQPYVQGMAAAGAANYANCIGVHHNAGATSPSATSGHPAGGGHYSWYFQPTLDVYYYGLGGALPVCLTEFGYLSGDGYGPLPDRFSWAATNTVQNQADWLAEGVTISKSLGYVRLMIVWNIDFTNYESDPQAGYAIIRPDGSCPACTTLGAAMGG